VGIRKRAGRAKPYMATADLGRARQGRRMRVTRSFERRSEARHRLDDQIAQRRRSRRAGRDRRPTVLVLLQDWSSHEQAVNDWSRGTATRPGG
jgi:hypothetical protein